MARRHDPDDRGDLYAEVKVALPTGLTARQRDLMRQFCDAGIPEAAGQASHETQEEQTK